MGLWPTLSMLWHLLSGIISLFYLEKLSFLPSSLKSYCHRTDSRSSHLTPEQDINPQIFIKKKSSLVYALGVDATLMLVICGQTACKSLWNEIMVGLAIRTGGGIGKGLLCLVPQVISLNNLP